MFSIKRKLLCFMILVFVIPLIVISSLYYIQSIDTVKKKSNSIIKEAFEEIDNSFQTKTNKVQHIAELITTNEVLCDVIRETDFTKPEEEIYESVAKLDVFFDRLLVNESEIKGVLLLLENRGIYEYNCNLRDKSVVGFYMQYGSINKAYSDVNWYDLSDSGYQLGAEADIMASVSLYDLYKEREKGTLATMYLLLDDGGIGASNSRKTDDASSTMVYDKNGSFVTYRGVRNFDITRKVSLDTGREILGSDEGDMKVDIDGKKYYCCYYKSPVTGWRFIRTEPYYDYFADLYGLQLMIIIMILAILVLVIIINEFFVKRFTKPLNNLIDGMKEVENENFKVSVPVVSKDEFGFLCQKFNIMIKRVDELIAKVVSEEKKRKETELLSMQYQIRPHFIYNTLGSIRMYALSKGEDEISEMLLVMGRFLRNTVHNVGRMLTIDEEIKNIGDYIELYKIRYDNSFEYRCLKEASVGECKIPSMMIQPIIENAFYHGLNTKIDGVYEAMVTLSVYECEKGICISILDNGVGIKDISKIYEKKTTDNIERLHIGIANTEKRIHDMFGNEYGISIKSEYGSYTQVDITLPKIIDDTGYEM